jgi:bacteriorhodopsin
MLVTPVLISNLGFLSGSPASHVVLPMCAGASMFGVGIAPALTSNSAVTFGLSLAAIFSYSYVFYTMRNSMQMRATAISEHQGRRFSVASALAAAAWGWLGTAELLMESGGLSPVVETSLTAVFDMMAVLGVTKIALRDQDVLRSADEVREYSLIPDVQRQWMMQVDERREEMGRQLRGMEVQMEQLQNRVMPLLHQLAERASQNADSQQKPPETPE